MHRWAACPGSVRLCSTVENRTTEYAAEGTVAHGLAQVALDPGLPPETYLGGKRSADGYEFIVSQEMVDAVNIFVESVNDDEIPGGKLFVEHKFDLSHIYAGLYGTADAVVWRPDEQLLIVKDFKYGAGVPVEVKDNPQLRYYALGALIDLGLPAKRVRMEVVQPRCPHPDGPIRAEEIDAIDLMDFSTDLIDYAKATEDINAALEPGEHCRFCPAAGICPALHAKAQNTAAQVFGADAPYAGDKLADTLHWLPILEGWIKSVREFAYTEAEAGRTPPGWKLVAKRANRKWHDADAAIRALAALGLGEPELYGVPALRSPAQIEETLTARKMKPKERTEALEPLVIKESSGNTLAVDSDARPAVKEAAADAFSNV